MRAVSTVTTATTGRRRPAALVRSTWGWACAHPLLATFVLAIVARLVLALGVTVVFGGVLFEDDLTYNQLARQVVNGQSALWSDYDRYLYNSTATFSVPLTIATWAFGEHAIVGQVLAALFGALAAMFTTKVASDTANVRTGLLAGAIVALLPSQVLFSSLTLKDSAVWACLAGLAAAVGVANRSAGRRLVAPTAGIVVLLVLLAHLRIHTLVMASMAVAIASFFGVREQRAVRVVGAALIAIVLPWTLGAGPAGYDVATKAGSLDTIRVANAFGAATAFVDNDANRTAAQLDRATERVEDIQERIEELQSTATTATTATTVTTATTAAPQETTVTTAAPSTTLPPEVAVEIDELEDQLDDAQETVEVIAAEIDPVAAAASADQSWVRSNVRHLPRGLSVMLVEPFPWNVGSNARLRLAAAELVLWYPLLALAVVGAVVAVRRRAATLVFPLLAAGGIAVMYGLAEGNFGTAYRHRGEMTWALAVFAALGVVSLVERRRGAAADADGEEPAYI